MSNTSGSRLDRPETPAGPDALEPPGGLKKLAAMNPLPPRETRPVTNLGRVFGQFAELQQQIVEQVTALEDSVQLQKQDIAVAMTQLPEVRERVNFLIASYYEQSKKDETVRERLNGHDATLATLVESARTAQEAQKQWRAAIDEVIQGLARARAVLST